MDGGFLAGAQRYRAPVRGLARDMGNWIAVLPFFMFALLFLILPTGFLMVGAFAVIACTCWTGAVR